MILYFREQEQCVCCKTNWKEVMDDVINLFEK